MANLRIGHGEINISNKQISFQNVNKSNKHNRHKYSEVVSIFGENTTKAQDIQDVQDGNILHLNVESKYGIWHET